jgi:hypothetical protein
MLGGSNVKNNKEKGYSPTEGITNNNNDDGSDDGAVNNKTHKYTRK